MNRDLLRTPRQAKLGACEPDAAALNDRRDLRTLDNQILHWDALVRAAIQVIELGVPLAIALRQLDLDVRWVGQHIALLVLAELQGWRVERLDHLLVQIGLEPCLGVLDTLIDHHLIHLLEHTLELLQLRALLLTAEGEIDRVLRAILGLEGVEAKRARHRHRGLHDQTTAIVVQVRLLGTRLQGARRGDRDALGLEVRRVDD